jgi:hypothetical protein
MTYQNIIYAVEDGLARLTLYAEGVSAFTNKRPPQFTGC